MRKTKTQAIASPVNILQFNHCLLRCNYVLRVKGPDKRLARDFLTSIRKYEERNLEIDRLLSEEVDQEVREGLQIEKETNLSVVADLKLKLAGIRKPVGADLKLRVVTL